MPYKTLKRVARETLTFFQSLAPYRHWTHALRDDPLFNLATVDRALAPRPVPPSRTAEQRLQVARRVIDAYRLASTHQAGRPDVYKVSNEWVPIFRRPLKPLLEALEKGDAEELRDLLDNFFRSTISHGLCGLGIDMTGTFFQKRPSRYVRMQMLIDSVYRYRLLEQLMPGTSPSDLTVEDFGNPYGMYVGDTFLRTGVDYQYYYAKLVSQMLEGPATVAELGGGIGGFAYFLNRVHAPGMTYINLDLPEILCISSYLLLNLYPAKRALLYGEQESIDSTLIAKYDIAMMPSFMIESLATDSVDVSFNSYSLAEMGPAAIRNYTAHMSRISRQAILHVNHVTHALLSADQFAFDPAKFELVSRTRALWNLGRDLKCDEYEFLLKRRST